MRRFAHKGKVDPQVISLVQSICRDLQQGDYVGELLACYYWVCQNVRYLRDIHDVEFVSEPGRVVKSGTGDCDDTATLLAAMAMVCGNRCSFVVACFDNPPTPSHVYVQVETPNGPLVLDPVANFETGKMLSRVTARKVYPV